MALNNSNSIYGGGAGERKEQTAGTGKKRPGSTK